MLCMTMLGGTRVPAPYACPPGAVLSSYQMFTEFIRDISVRLALLEGDGQVPRAVALREDLWPVIGDWNGYPVVRLRIPTSVLWGVLA